MTVYRCAHAWLADGVVDNVDITVIDGRIAQIDPQADTSPYASILNLFDAPETTMGLTSWDNAYLKGLYKAQRTRQNTRAGNGEIIASIQRTRQHLRSSTDDEALPQP